MFNSAFKKDSEPQPKTYENTSNEIVVESFSKLLNRRTERFFTDENISKEKFEELIMKFNNSIRNNHWLSYRVLVQGVDGYDKAVYKPDEQGKLIKAVDSYTKKDLMEAVHGQWWLNGAGFCFFLVVDLNALKNKNSADNPQSYFEMIVQLGAAGQALLNTVYKHELGSWMTPAVCNLANYFAVFLANCFAQFGELFCVATLNSHNSKAFFLGSSARFSNRMEISGFEAQQKVIFKSLLPKRVRS